MRVLIVDDSPSMRAMLRSILSADPCIEVVGAASDPHKARELIRQLAPDVLTLDVEMPGMNGIAFLERVMRLRPMPVVMCSSMTARGTDIAIEAMRLGAVDCIAKPAGGAAVLQASAGQLCATVKDAARATIRPISHDTGRPLHARPAQTTDRVIAIGASTGGVEALFALLSALPAQAPPILIVQHMPGLFTTGFAARLDRLCPMRVVEAKDGDPLLPGTAYVAPGSDMHMEVAPVGAGHVRLRAGPPVSGHRPSVDALFASCAALGERAVGVIMTGMGSDGAAGLLAMRAAGAATFGQNEQSCIIYGMPRAARLRGAVEQELDLAALPRALLRACSRKRGTA